MRDRFTCKNCKREVIATGFIGTKNRNHCPFCLWSLHVDLENPGDRSEGCKGLMMPIALTFKNEGLDKYGKKKQGELMLVHICEKCGVVSINRIAGDDNPDQLIRVFKASLLLNQQNIDVLMQRNISILNEKDQDEIKIQLFGRGVK